jgi:hypothetical protein
MARLNVSLTNPDPELAAVQARMTHTLPTLVDGALGANSVDSVGLANAGCAIDLIGHSMNGIMYFASWTIDQTEGISSTLRASWPSGTPTEIRLLACNTAATADAIASLQHLQSVMGVTVYGATTPLYANDFGPDGFTSTDVLVPADGLATRPASLSTPQIQSWFDRFSPYEDRTFEDVRDDLQVETRPQLAAVQQRRHASRKVHALPLEALDTVLGGAHPEPRRAPGLLAVPDGEAIFETGPDQHVRVSYLLGGAFLRVYTDSEPGGVVFRTRGPRQLAGGAAVTAA